MSIISVLTTTPPISFFLSFLFSFVLCLRIASDVVVALGVGFVDVAAVIVPSLPECPRRSVTCDWHRPRTTGASTLGPGNHQMPALIP